MTLEELREACGDGVGGLMLVLPRVATSEKIRLTPRSGPLGYVCSVNYKNETVASFDCKAILRWIDRQERSG